MGNKDFTMNKGFIQYNQVTFSWFNLLNKQKDFTYTTYYSLHRPYPTPTSLTNPIRSTDILPTTKKSVYLVVNCICVESLRYIFKILS